MLLNKSIIDNLTASAHSSPRLRMNYNLHESFEDSVQRMFSKSPLARMAVPI